MILGEPNDQNKRDLENIYYETNFAIRETLKSLNVAEVDKTTYAKLINVVTRDPLVLSSDYSYDDLIRIIKN